MPNHYYPQITHIQRVAINNNGKEMTSRRSHIPSETFNLPNNISIINRTSGEIYFNIGDGAHLISSPTDSTKDVLKDFFATSLEVIKFNFKILNSKPEELFKDLQSCNFAQNSKILSCSNKRYIHGLNKTKNILQYNYEIFRKQLLQLLKNNLNAIKPTNEILEPEKETTLSKLWKRYFVEVGDVLPDDTINIFDLAPQQLKNNVQNAFAFMLVLYCKAREDENYFRPIYDSFKNLSVSSKNELEKN